MLFSSPTMLWEACKEYFEWCEANPLLEIDYRGKPLQLIYLPHTRPFTLFGLCTFLDVNTHYFNDLEARLKQKDDEISKDFTEVITRVREIIYNQKFTGAAVGFFNANIIARDLGLTDKAEQSVTVNKPVIIEWNNPIDQLPADPETEGGA